MSPLETCFRALTESALPARRTGPACHGLHTRVRPETPGFTGGLLHPIPGLDHV